jgi:hypothetical protein
MQRIVIVLASALVVLLAPVSLHAQSNKLIVMDCPTGPGGQHVVITLDLAAKTAAEEWTIPNPGSLDIHQSYPKGTITQITDDKIVFISDQGDPQNNEATNTLNRYTGDNTYTFTDGRATNTIHCVKRQKQF